jgi:hypothetical protein
MSLWHEWSPRVILKAKNKGYGATCQVGSKIKSRAGSKDVDMNNNTVSASYK